MCWCFFCLCIYPGGVDDGCMETLLEEFLVRMSDEVGNSSLWTKGQEQQYNLYCGDVVVSVKWLEPGLLLNARLGELPKKNLESFFIEIMQANYLGMGTGRSVIGLDPAEKFLTLSHLIPYEVNYTLFKDTIEAFLNYHACWEEKIKKFIEEAGE